MTYLERLKLNRDIMNHRIKWGVRRYQNDYDGTLTEEAKKRYMAEEIVDEPEKCHKGMPRHRPLKA